VPETSSGDQMLAAARASQMLHTATAAKGYLDPSAARWERPLAASTWRISVSRSVDMTHPQCFNPSVYESIVALAGWAGRGRSARSKEVFGDRKPHRQTARSGSKDALIDQSSC
jgi:hypothetical protein